MAVNILATYNTKEEWQARKPNPKVPGSWTSLPLEYIFDSSADANKKRSVETCLSRSSFLRTAECVCPPLLSLQ
jgi:hypothetical protein